MSDTRLSLPLQTKFADLSAKGEFTGLASPYGNVDLQGDIVMPGAFDRSLAEHKSRGSTPALLWHHRMDEPIGRIHGLTESQKGLEITGKLTLGVPRADDAYKLMSDGALGLSIGYQATDTGEGTGGVRLLKQVDLHEVSAVSYPANPQAKITDFKSLSKRELETKLHDFGLSVRDARRLVSGGWSALTDDSSQEINQVAQLIRASTKRY